MTVSLIICVYLVLGFLRMRKTIQAVLSEESTATPGALLLFVVMVLILWPGIIVRSWYLSIKEGLIAWKQHRLSQEQSDECTEGGPSRRS